MYLAWNAHVEAYADERIAIEDFGRSALENLCASANLTCPFIDRATRTGAFNKRMNHRDREYTLSLDDLATAINASTPVVRPLACAPPRRAPRPTVDAGKIVAKIVAMGKRYGYGAECFDDAPPAGAMAAAPGVALDDLGRKVDDLEAGVARLNDEVRDIKRAMAALRAQQRGGLVP